MRVTICDNCECIVKAKEADYYIIKIYKNEDWKDIRCIELCYECYNKTMFGDIYPKEAAIIK